VSGSGDFDGDGMSDQSEYTAGLDPTQTGSVLRLKATLLETTIELHWDAATGRTLDPASIGARFYRLLVDWEQ